MRKFAKYHLGNIVYGANDGIITTFAVVSAAAGAGLTATIIVILGIANLAADGFSMGASKYLSLRSEQAVGQERGRRPLADGVATFLAFVTAGTLPLIPFFVPGTAEHAFLVSSFAAAAAFYVVGSARSLVTGANSVSSGLEMLVVGGTAAMIAYGLGSVVETLISSL
jgi:VIT1/CCC1 family predicted Fe2+/Mn2+ transporter